MPSSHPLRKVYDGMRQRCLNPKGRSYARYGGRGISICERWQKSFELFVADMGPRPDGHTLDRIDNDGPYSPENCRWASWRVQGRNRRSNRIIEFRGEKLLLSEWAEKIGITKDAMHMRLANGWPLEHALTRPSCRVLGKYLHKRGEAPPVGSGRKRSAAQVTP